jgi:PADRE domain
MGLKSLSLQMVPWCFHMVTGQEPDANSTARSEPIRLVGSDGRVVVYHRPVSAAELMKEHPCHLICRSDSFFIGQKVPALSAGERLQPGQSYFVLPSQFFHSVLSFVSLASSLLVSNTQNNGKKMPALRPFDIQKTAAGTLQIRVCDEFLVGKVTEEELETRGRVCSSAELEKEYKELCCKVNKWRPRLDAVREGVERRKGRGKGFLVFSGFVRRRRKND